MSRKKNNGNRKNRPSRQNYKDAKRWLSNKVRKIARHLKQYPEDLQAKSALSKAEHSAKLAGISV